MYRKSFTQSKSFSTNIHNFPSAPDTARTCNLQFRRLSLYPVELRVLFTEPLTIGHNVILARRKAFAVRPALTVHHSPFPRFGVQSSRFGVRWRSGFGVRGLLNSVFCILYSVFCILTFKCPLPQNKAPVA